MKTEKEWSEVQEERQRSPAPKRSLTEEGVSGIESYWEVREAKNENVSWIGDKEVVGHVGGNRPCIRWRLKPNCHEVES